MGVLKAQPGGDIFSQCSYFPSFANNNSDRPRQACGETPSEYGLNRPDAIFALRSAYAEAQKILAAQDAYCSNVEAGRWDVLGLFPENPQFEMLVDVLRGKVKVVLVHSPHLNH